ncbi:MAG: hypothetical protein V4690_03540 [Patescibacteria group bacterium]
MFKHSVRALAFHHEKGYEAQRELALNFAGTGGRIATMEDIVHACCNSQNIKDFVWSRTIITSSYLFAGWNNTVPTLVFAHGLNIQPVTYPTRYGNEYRIGQPVFEALLDGKFGHVESVNLLEYKNKSKHVRGSNRYTYEVAHQDPIIRGFFGRQVDVFLNHYHNLTQDWLKDASLEEQKEAVLLINRIYEIYNNKPGKQESFSNIPRDYAKAYPLTKESHGLYVDHNKQDKHIACGMDFSTSTNSGIDDLGGPAYYIIGVRGEEPLTKVAPDFRSSISKVKENWPHFVQPLVQVPNDPYIGIKPDGSTERPYYLPALMRIGESEYEPRVTGRILDNGTGSIMPEFRVRSCKMIGTLTKICYQGTGREAGSGYIGYPYQGQWEAALKALPKEANAIAFGGSSHHNGKIEVDTVFYKLELDKEPFHILIKCGDKFFTQYNDENRPTQQPHMLVTEVTELDQKPSLHIPDDVHRLCNNHLKEWPVLAYLIANAPEKANAMWIENQSTHYSDKAGKNITTVSVRYYHVALGDKAFRPFTEIRSDFDWELERRTEANMLSII